MAVTLAPPNLAAAGRSRRAPALQAHDGDAGAQAVAAGLPEALVYAGWSLGVMAAQQLAQNRPGARGLLGAGVLRRPGYYGSWPDGHAAQIHGMADDEWFAEDRAAADAFVAGRADAELFVYPGDHHLFADDSLPACDEAAAALLTERVLAFLDRIG